MCILIFSTSFVRKISHSKKKRARYCHKCTNSFMQGIHYSHILMKLEVSLQVLEKYSNIKFYENPFSERRASPCGLTHITNKTVAFRNCATAPKILCRAYRKTQHDQVAAPSSRWNYRSVCFKNKETTDERDGGVAHEQCDSASFSLSLSHTHTHTHTYTNTHTRA
jgi:hypothetical protein